MTTATTVSEPTAPARQTLPAGAMIADRYRALHLLGSGGAASVYSVQDTTTGRTLALKRIETGAARHGHSSRVALEREYYTLTQLRHPNIVSVRDFGCDGDAVFYTMELLDGEDARALPPLPWQRTCALLADIASALALIHSRSLVHGDVSARNVRCDGDGRATLIDFGAMCTVGAPAPLTGTPPHVAPELGTGQPVDGRVDLYALGALAYWLLSGQHAYPARSLRELAAAWRSPPARLATIAAVPAELDALVMSLIAPNPIARPSSAADVLDRLLAIGGLPRREGPATAGAYFANPKLVQREPQLERLLELLDGAENGHSRAVVIDGEAGLGASRLLREVVVRARTRGALVLSTAAGAESRAFGVARDLARQLFAVAGGPSSDAAAPYRSALDRLNPAIADEEPGAETEDGGSQPQPIERRARVAAALRDCFSAVAREQLVVIAVADVRSCDTTSLGVLAALSARCAAASGSRLLLAVTLGASGGASPMLLEELRQRSIAMPLEPLDRAGSLALARSVFGAVPHVERLAELTHDRCLGNPLLSQELWRHLADRGVIHYRDGAWWIPQALTIPDVPSNLNAWYRSRVGELSGNARELAELLAVRGASLTIADCVSLLDAAPESVFEALDVLTRARIVRVSGTHVFLAQQGLQPALLANSSPPRQAQLHKRIGQALLSRGFESQLGKLEAGYHLVRGGTPATGADLIADAAADTAALFEASGADAVCALEAALAHYDQHRGQPRRILRILVALTRCAFLFDPSLARYAPRTIAALRRDTGLTLADELAAQHPEQPRVEHVQRAMMVTAQHYVELPVDDRGFQLDEAIEHLLLTAFSLMGTAVNRLDLPGVQKVVELVAPLAELGIAPAVATRKLMLTVVDAMQGRQARAQAGRHAFVAELTAGSLFRGVSEERRRTLLAAQLHGIGLLESLNGGEQGLRRADEVDDLGLATFAAAAMQIRVLTHLFNGDRARADACRAQLDVLTLQHAPAWHLDTWILPYLAGPYELWGDVLGLKHAVAQLQLAASGNPGFEPFLRYARGAYHRERGELALAREELATALELAPAGEHVAWSPAIAAYVHTLVCAGDYREAIDEGQHAMELARREGLAELWVCGRIAPQIALARAHLGEHELAAADLDRFITESERDGSPRPILGKCYEARARIALLAGDRDAFVRAAHRAGVCFGATGNPTLIAAHDRLWQAANEAQRWHPRQPQIDVATI